MDKTELLRTMRDAHAPIAAAAAGLTDADLVAEAPGMPGWTRKDVLAHIEWWHRRSIAVLEGVRSGEDPFPPGDEPWDLDAQNARTLEEHRHRPAADVRAGEPVSFEALVAAVESATDDELFGADAAPWLGGEPAARVVQGDTWDHYPEHVPHLGTRP